MKRSGFTLVEIMLSASIMAVLTVIVFVNFSRQNQKESLSLSIGQITTEIQHMTANAQSGILFGTLTPVQYGLTFELVDASNNPMKTFDTFGDFNPISTPSSIYNNGGSETIQTFTFQKHIAVSCLSTTANQQLKRLDLGYSLPGARFTAVGILVGTNSVINLASRTIRITLRDDRTNECQRVTMVTGVTTFSRQKLATCSCP